MVYRIIKKIILISIIYLIPINLNSNIIYDKGDVIISDIDLNYYKQLYFENFGEELNDPTAIKNIVIIKNVIDNCRFRIFFTFNRGRPQLKKAFFIRKYIA